MKENDDNDSDRELSERRGGGGGEEGTYLERKEVELVAGGRAGGEESAGDEDDVRGIDSWQGRKGDVGQETIMSSWEGRAEKMSSRSDRLVCRWTGLQRGKMGNQRGELERQLCMKWENKDL